MGWNAAREQIFANQKRLGVIPQDAKLTPWPDDLLKKWDDLPAEEKRLFARQMEVYAAYLAYTDHEIGRVIQAIQDTGKLDNTLIIYISGDNGSSAEGTPNGTPNEMTTFNGIDVPVAEQMKFIDVWGSDQTYPHMAVGWTWAMDTPFKWTKQIASHFGGTRQGVAISWPNRIKDAGGIRNQFHHVIDIVPTILEATGIAAPLQVNGIAQKPIEGVSMAYTFDKANAATPSTRTTQYFEMFGMRALYHEGWMASTTPYRAPWKITDPTPKDIVNGVKWELYNISQGLDPVRRCGGNQSRQTQGTSGSVLGGGAKIPGTAARCVGVHARRRSAPEHHGRTVRVHLHGPVTGILPGNEPNILNKSYVITADITVPAGGGEGMLVTDGGRFGGYGLYLLKGKPVLLYNLEGVARFRWEGAQALTPGKHTIAFSFKYDGPGYGKGGTGVLSVDGKEVARQTIPHSVPFIFGVDESFDVGSDTGTSVEDKDYQPPFAFNGALSKLTIKLEPAH